MRFPRILSLGVLFIAFGFAASPAAPAPFFNQGPDLLTLSTDPFLMKVLYEHPDRMVSGVAASGAISVNAQWENKEVTEWFIEQQRGGADLVQAGVLAHKDALIKQGITVINWGFAHQGPQGDFPGTGDPLHSTSFFVEAAARSALLLKQARLTAYDAQVKEWTPKIRSAAHWMIKPEVATKGREKNLDPYTHRFYLRAAALGLASAVTGDTALAEAAAKYAREGLTKQQPDGTNPEKGGFDVSYQGVGAAFALRYVTVCADPKLKDALKAMAGKALAGVSSHMAADGTLSTEDSSRVGQEVSRAGKTKTVDYRMILQGLIFAEKLNGDKASRQIAEKLAKGHKWALMEFPRAAVAKAMISTDEAVRN